MQHADRLTVVHHDDTHTDYTDVRYTITRHGLRILDTLGAETVHHGNDVLTTHALRHRRTPAGSIR